MRLYKLIGLEMEALPEYGETMRNIALYEDVLNNYDSMAAVIMKDLDQIKKEYGSRRRTIIENAKPYTKKENGRDGSYIPDGSFWLYESD